MEDLLKEEEFLQQKDNYNPWRGFVWFYVFAILHFAGMFTFLEYVNMPETLEAVISVILCILLISMPFTIIFHKRKNIMLPPKTIVFSICILMTSYFVSHVLLKVFGGAAVFLSYSYVYYLIAWGVLLAYGFFCLLIILLIRKRKLKKLLKPQ